MRVIYLIMTIIVSCNITKPHTSMCDKDKAIELCDQIIKKRGYKIESLHRIVTEDNVSYIVHYQPNDTLIRGNEAKIIINKSNCMIKEKKFFQ